MPEKENEFRVQEKTKQLTSGEGMLPNRTDHPIHRHDRGKTRDEPLLGPSGKKIS